jgi:hypothetical protein
VPTRIQSKPTPSGVARQLVTFLVLPRKVTKRRRPQRAAPAGFPRYFANKRGCATRPSGAHTPCPTAELEQCSPKPPLVCEISRRRTGDEKAKIKSTGWALRAHLQLVFGRIKPRMGKESKNTSSQILELVQSVGDAHLYQNTCSLIV